MHSRFVSGGGPTIRPHWLISIAHALYSFAPLVAFKEKYGDELVVPAAQAVLGGGQELTDVPRSWDRGARIFLLPTKLGMGKTCERCGTLPGCFPSQPIHSTMSFLPDCLCVPSSQGLCRVQVWCLALLFSFSGQPPRTHAVQMLARNGLSNDSACCEHLTLHREPVDMGSTGVLQLCTVEDRRGAPRVGGNEA